MSRDLETAAAPLGPAAPIFHVVGEGLLPRVEVDGGDPLPEIHQGDGKMHRKGRFSGAALFVADHDDMRGKGSSRAHLHQHAIYSLRTPILRRSNLRFPAGTRSDYGDIRLPHRKPIVPSRRGGRAGGALAERADTVNELAAVTIPIADRCRQ